MPKISRWHLKLGMIYLVLALLLAVLFQLQPLLDLSPTIHKFRPIFYHALMIGWITQIIIGVSIWMFPKESKANPRGNELLNWMTFYFLNIGFLLRAFSEPFITADSSAFLNYSLLLSGILQWLAGMFYVANIWTRVKTK